MRFFSPGCRCFDVARREEIDELIGLSVAKSPKFVSDSTPLRSDPFAALATKFAGLADRGSQTCSEVVERNADILPVLACADPISELKRIVVQRQKKGQGGKTVTRIEGVGAEVEHAVLDRLKRELGCGGRLEDGAVILGTGDHRRVADWFRRVGAKRLIVGN